MKVRRTQHWYSICITDLALWLDFLTCPKKKDHLRSEVVSHKTALEFWST